ncbi:MAG: pyridoxal phosphate-dependent aminotransferase [Chloroflexota bacterium]|nr:pyridoxal phosphate-dependent aminotransferase [Chloroflexota bacterium]MDQ5866243.1 pyridoxal phosphate-dependent aminotransferase [Chloroflexota bacterium]
MKLRLADRMTRLGTETAFEVAARARALEAQGKPIIHLEIGEPDFDTPTNVREEAKRALDEGYTHYSNSTGILELREAIAEYAGRNRGLTFDPANVIVTPGAKPIMFYAIMALVEEGEEVIYPNPGFPIYESMINFLGGKPVPLHLRESNDFRIDLDELESKVTEKTRMIIFNSPHNPTGGVLTRDDLKAIADLAVRHDIMVLADEIYSEIVYEGEHHTILSFPGMEERTILLDGFSKTFAMTGWRLGYGVFPPEMVPHVSRLIINSVSCTSTFSQRAAIAALTGPRDDVNHMLQAFAERRELVYEGLNNIPGFSCNRPAGAFYAFPNITGTGMNSRAYADYLLTEADVAVLPGTSFGAFGEGYIRISFANSADNLREAMRRIEEANRRLPSLKAEAGAAT